MDEVWGDMLVVVSCVLFVLQNVAIMLLIFRYVKSTNLRKYCRRLVLILRIRDTDYFFYFNRACIYTLKKFQIYEGSSK